MLLTHRGAVEHLAGVRAGLFGEVEAAAALEVVEERFVRRRERRRQAVRRGCQPCGWQGLDAAEKLQKLATIHGCLLSR